MTTLLISRTKGRLTAPSAAVVPAAAARPPVFFAAEIQGKLEQEDHEAWTAIAGIFITIVTLGVVIGIGAVLLAL